MQYEVRCSFDLAVRLLCRQRRREQHERSLAAHSVRRRLPKLARFCSCRGVCSRSSSHVRKQPSARAFWSHPYAFFRLARCGVTDIFVDTWNNGAAPYCAPLDACSLSARFIFPSTFTNSPFSFHVWPHSLLVGVTFFKSPSTLQLLGPSSAGPDVLGAVTSAALSSPHPFKVHAWLEYVCITRVVAHVLTAVAQVRLHRLQRQQRQRTVRASQGQGLDFGIFQRETHPKRCINEVSNASNRDSPGSTAVLATCKT